MSIALHDVLEGLPVDVSYKGKTYRRPHHELVALAFELNEGPQASLTMPVLQRVAAAWRDNGSLIETALIPAMRAAQAEGPFVWQDITSAIVDFENWKDALAQLRFAELAEEMNSATSPAMYKLRRKIFTDELRTWSRQVVEANTPF